MERRTSRLITYVASFLLFWAIAAPSAHAYIDPGSSSFIVQILIGAAAGAGLAIATFWRRIRAFFSRKKDAPPAVAPSEGSVSTPPSSSVPSASPSVPSASPSVPPPTPAPATPPPSSPVVPPPSDATTDATSDAPSGSTNTNPE